MIPLTTLIDLQGIAGWTAMLLPFGILAMVLGFALYDSTIAARRSAEIAAKAGAGGRADAAVGDGDVAPPPTDARRPAETSIARTQPPSAVSAEPSVATRPSLSPPVPPPPAPPPPTPPPTVARAPVLPPVAAPAPAPAVPAGEAPPPPAVASPATTPPESAAPPIAAPSMAVLMQALADAEAAENPAEAARLSLEVGRRLPPGDEAERHLRRAVILASQLRNSRLHSAARLELGDRVAARGDMTTACEHWQIARQIYWDENRAEELAEADRRMIAAGCPTDWVLNDF